MIPKVIHYCWFGGGEQSPKMRKCIESWSKFCPDYEIVEWNETNYDVRKNAYLACCCDNKKWAFLSDYARLDIICENGGVYFDTDVEVVAGFDDLLEQKAFFGFETDAFVNTGLGFGSEKGGAAVRQMLQVYAPLLDGQHGTVVCPKLNTQALVELGLKADGTLQRFDDFTVYPADWFNPYDDPTGRLNKTNNTRSIHWYSKSWMDPKTVLRSKLTKPLHRVFGTDAFRKFRK